MQIIEALDLSSVAVDTLAVETITVDTLVDEEDGNLAKGDVSLREAIAAVQSGGTIRFDSALAQQDAGFGNGVVGLSLGELVIDKSMNIVGLGANELSISGDYRSRVFLLDDGEASAIDVAISRLTIAEGKSDGQAGGILSVGENLRFVDGELLANEGAIATADETDAAITIRRSAIFASDDFGISTKGELKIVDSQLIKNSGVSIEHDGNLILRRSGVSSGSSSGIVSKGGLSVVDSQVESNSGEGITHTGTALIQNSSVTGNIGEGIIGTGINALNLVNSTVESNGADGILTSGIVSIRETSIANNAGNGITFRSDPFAPEDLQISDSFIVSNTGVGIFVDGEFDFSERISDSVISRNGSEAIIPEAEEAIAPTEEASTEEIPTGEVPAEVLPTEETNPPADTTANLIEGTSGNNTINGTKGNDLIHAFGGSDTVYGRSGDDIIAGGRGKDTIFGGGGQDQLFGGDSDDVLGGGRGQDLLSGGAGRDVFVIGGLYEGKDTILDFKVGADLIDLSAIFANAQYDSATPFDDYVQLSQSSSGGTSVSVLDLNRSTSTQSVFKAIAIIENTAPAEIGGQSFVL